MGLANYFKADAAGPSAPSPSFQESSPRSRRDSPTHHHRDHNNHHSLSTSSQRDVASALSMSDKPASALSYNDMELQPPRNFSRPQSISGRSVRSAGSSMMLDDIRHEVMVNYLYQQQCSHLWVSDGSGEVEGVLLRKSRGHYMACPPHLGSSPFALACAALNVQVSPLIPFTLPISSLLILCDSAP
jgi:hypothetical protein